MKFKRTFTLIEVLIVLALLSIFGALLAPAGVNLLREVKVKQDLEKLNHSIDQVELLGLLNQSEWFLELKQEKNRLQVVIRMKDNPKVFAKETFKNLKMKGLSSSSFSFHPVLLWGVEKKINLVDYKNNEIFLPLK